MARFASKSMQGNSIQKLEDMRGKICSNFYCKIVRFYTRLARFYFQDHFVEKDFYFTSTSDKKRLKKDVRPTIEIESLQYFVPRLQICQPPKKKKVPNVVAIDPTRVVKTIPILPRPPEVRVENVK